MLRARFLLYVAEHPRTPAAFVPETTMSDKKILRLPAVVERVGLRRSAIYAAIQRGQFPSPIKLLPSGRAAGWSEREIEEWILSRLRESGKRGVGDDG